MHNHIGVPNIGVSIVHKGSYQPQLDQYIFFLFTYGGHFFFSTYLSHNQRSVNVEANDPNVLILMNHFSLLVNLKLLPKFSDQTYLHVALIDAASIVLEKQPQPRLLLSCFGLTYFFYFGDFHDSNSFESFFMCDILCSR